MRPDVPEHELVAIGRGFGDMIRTRHATGTSDVLQYYLLIEDTTHTRRDHSPEYVRWPSCCERDDHRHRPFRKVLCLS